MNILAQTFQSSLADLPTTLVISTDSPFVEVSTETPYLPGELARVECTITDGDVVVGAISDIPASNDLDIQGLFYTVNLYQTKGSKQTEVPFLFGYDNNPITKIRIPETVSGNITWNDIRTASMGIYPALPYKPTFLDVEQQFRTFITEATNTPETVTTMGALINGSTNKTTPIDADHVAIRDSVSGLLQKVSFLNLWNYIKAKADSLYQAILVSGTNIKTINGTSLLGSGNIVVSGGEGTGVTDGDKGDIVVSGSGLVWTLDEVKEAFLLDRSNHEGTQLAETISDLSAAVEEILGIEVEGHGLSGYTITNVTTPLRTLDGETATIDDILNVIASIVTDVRLGGDPNNAVIIALRNGVVGAGDDLNKLYNLILARAKMELLPDDVWPGSVERGKFYFTASGKPIVGILENTPAEILVAPEPGSGDDNNLFGLNADSSAHEYKTVTGAGGVAINFSLGAIEIDGSGIVGGGGVIASGTFSLDDGDSTASGTFTFDDGDSN